MSGTRGEHLIDPNFAVCDVPFSLKQISHASLSPEKKDVSLERFLDVKGPRFSKDIPSPKDAPMHLPQTSSLRQSIKSIAQYVSLFRFSTAAISREIRAPDTDTKNKWIQVHFQIVNCATVHLNEHSFGASGAEMMQSCHSASVRFQHTLIRVLHLEARIFIWQVVRVFGTKYRLLKKKREKKWNKKSFQ